MILDSIYYTDLGKAVLDLVAETESEETDLLKLTKAIRRVIHEQLRTNRIFSDAEDIALLACLVYDEKGLLELPYKLYRDLYPKIETIHAIFDAYVTHTKVTVSNLELYIDCLYYLLGEPEYPISWLVGRISSYSDITVTLNGVTYRIQ